MLVTTARDKAWDFDSLSTHEREKPTRNVRRCSLFQVQIMVVTSFAWISHAKTDETLEEKPTVLKSVDVNFDPVLLC